MLKLGTYLVIECLVAVLTFESLIEMTSEDMGLVVPVKIMG